MRRTTFREATAFTMLELIFVIVVVGILAVVIIPRMQQSRLREVADQIASHIRYTQHLAMQDDRYDPNDRVWYKKRWQIVFSTSVEIDNKIAYTVFRDIAGTSTGNPDRSEIAKNPLDPSKMLSAGSSGGVNYNDRDITKELSIGKRYGITNVIFSNSCSISGSRRIAFDYMGRPMKGNSASYNSAYPNNRLITQVCTITLTNDAGENIDITIQPETGYASVGQIY